MSIGSITVDLLARTGSFQTDLDRAGKHAQRRMLEIEKAVEAAARGVAIAMTAISGAAVSMVRNATNAADELSKMSQRTGVAVEELSRLSHAVGLNDASMQDLERGLKNLSTQMDAAANGTGEAARWFSQLGIEIKTSAGQMRPVEEVLLDIADAFQKMPDGAQKMAAANAMMSRAGQALIPTLNAGRDGISAMGDELVRFGGEVSTTFAQAAVEFNDNLTRMNALQKSFGLVLANETVPILNELTSALIAIGEESDIASLASAALRTVLETIIVVGANVAFVFKGIGTEIGGIAAQLAALARLDFDAFSAIGQMMKEDAAAARAELDAFERRVLGAADAHKALSSVLSDARRKTVDHNAAVERLMSLYQAGTINAKQFQTGAEQLDRIFRGTGRSAGILSDGIVRTGSSAKTSAKDVDKLGEFISNLWREQERAQEQLEQTFEGLRRSYDSVYSQQARFAEGSRVLIQAFRSGLIPSVEELQQQMMMLRDSIYEVEEPIQRLVVEVDPVAAAWEEAGKRIDEAFANAWKGAFDSFKSFSDQIKDAFKSLLGELAHMAITRPILVRMGVLSGGMGAAGTAAASAGGGASFGLPGIGSFLGGGLLSAGSALGAGTAAGGFLTGMGTAFSSGAGLFGTASAGASLLGAAGGTATGLGMIAGAALPIVGAIGLLGGLFGGRERPTNFWQGTDIDVASGSIRQTGSFDPSSRRFNQANRTAADELGSYLLTLTQQLSGLSGTSPIDQLAVGVGSRDKHFTINGVKTELPRASIDELVNTVVGEIVDSFGDDLPEQFRAVLESMTDEGDRALEMLAMMQDEFSALSTESERFERAQRDMSRAFDGLGVTMPRSVDEFKRLAAGIDLTTTEGRDLYAGLYQLAPAFQQIASVVDQVFDSISRTTAQSIRDIELSVLDSAGKYGYLDAETDRLLGELTQATAPDDINRLFESINRNITTAFGLLDSGEQKRLATQFIDRLLEAESIAQSRLSVSPIEDRTADEQAAAATAQREAAEMQRAAAREQHEAAAEARRVAERLEAALRSIPDRITVDNRMQIVASEVGVR
jgi:hypothetical protein